MICFILFHMVPNMTTDDLVATAEHLRRAADADMDRAARARRLALDLARRRSILRARLDQCRARHTAAVWSSTAAERSRQALTGGVGLSIWLANERLHATIRDLTTTADRLEETAHRRRLDAVGADTTRAAAE